MELDQSLIRSNTGYTYYDIGYISRHGIYKAYTYEYINFLVVWVPVSGAFAFFAMQVGIYLKLAHENAGNTKEHISQLSVSAYHNDPRIMYR